MRNRLLVLGAVTVTAAGAARVRSGRRYRAGLQLPRSAALAPVRTEDGVELYVETDGDPGAPVVVLFSHGFTARLEEFDVQRDALRARAQLVLYDQRGHGRSGWGDVHRATIDQLGRDLGAVLDRVTAEVAGGRPVVLVGHSMGGMSIMSLCRQQPERLGGDIAGLGLIATSAAPEDDDPLWALVTPLTRLHLLHPYLSAIRLVSPVLEAVRHRGARGGRAVTRRFLFGRDDRDPALLEEIQAMLEETPLTVTAAFYPTFVDHDDRAVLPSLGAVPTVVVVGSDDRLTPLAANRRIAEESGAELVVEPGAGHSVNVTRPEATNAALHRLLDRVLAGAGARPGDTSGTVAAAG
jgi:pimeloyl-ACP methyl ester carboxylesterase